MKIFQETEYEMKIKDGIEIDAPGAESREERDPLTMLSVATIVLIVLLWIFAVL
jgi:hypothetical protein